MSRSGYSDECENLELWRANVARSIHGKKGQAFLRELVQHLEAMPEKKLITNDLQQDGCYCTLGVVAAARGVDVSEIDMTDEWDAGFQIGRALKMPTILAQEIMWQNDEGAFVRDNRVVSPKTPEERYECMLSWARSKIATTESIGTATAVEPNSQNRDPHMIQTKTKGDSSFSR